MTHTSVALAHTLVQSEPFMSLLDEIANEERERLVTRLRAAAKGGNALDARAAEAEIAVWDGLEAAFRERASQYRTETE